MSANIRRLFAVLLLAVGTLTVVVQWGWTSGRDGAASRAAVLEYFASMERGDAVAEVVRSCSSDPMPLSQRAGPEAAEALSPASLAGSEVRVGGGSDGHGERWHDFEVPGRAHGTVALAVTNGPGEWRVCGLLSFELPAPR